MFADYAIFLHASFSALHDAAARVFSEGSLGRLHAADIERFVQQTQVVHATAQFWVDDPQFRLLSIVDNELRQAAALFVKFARVRDLDTTVLESASRMQSGGPLSHAAAAVKMLASERLSRLHDLPESITRPLWKAYISDGMIRPLVIVSEGSVLLLHHQFGHTQMRDLLSDLFDQTDLVSVAVSYDTVERCTVVSLGTSGGRINSYPERSIRTAVRVMKTFLDAPWIPKPVRFPEFEAWLKKTERS